MEGAELADLGRVDRDVRRAHAALEAWRAALAKDPEARADDEPLGSLRHVAGKTAYDAVSAGADGASSDAPHRAALARWIAHLTQARVTREEDARLARDADAREARYALDPTRTVSWREAWRGVVLSRTREEHEAWLAAAAERAPVLAPTLRERAARREEVARRLGLDGAHALVTRVPLAALDAACEALLAATRDAWREVLKDARPKGERAPAPSPLDALRVAVAADAPEGWPARLAPRWLLALFPRVADGLRLELGALPEPAGASSFARALGQFGRAVRVAGASPSLPFALARDPSCADAWRFSNAFAALAASREFQRRALGNGERTAAAQSRVLSRALLAGARLSAARALLARAPERFEELTDAALGAPMPRALAGAWPAARDDEPARTLALFTSLPLARELVERFDVDWFRNPRAATFLRARASAPTFDDARELDASAPAALARAFEEALA